MKQARTSVDDPAAIGVSSAETPGPPEAETRPSAASKGQRAPATAARKVQKQPAAPPSAAPEEVSKRINGLLSIVSGPSLAAPKGASKTRERRPSKGPSGHGNAKDVNAGPDAEARNAGGKGEGHKGKPEKGERAKGGKGDRGSGGKGKGTELEGEKEEATRCWKGDRSQGEKGNELEGETDDASRSWQGEEWWAGRRQKEQDWQGWSWTQDGWSWVEEKVWTEEKPRQRGTEKWGDEEASEDEWSGRQEPKKHVPEESRVVDPVPPWRRASNASSSSTEARAEKLPEVSKKEEPVSGLRLNPDAPVFVPPSQGQVETLPTAPMVILPEMLVNPEEVFGDYGGEHWSFQEQSYWGPVGGNDDEFAMYGVESPQSLSPGMLSAGGGASPGTGDGFPEVVPGPNDGEYLGLDLICEMGEWAVLREKKPQCKPFFWNMVTFEKTWEAPEEIQEMGVTDLIERYSKELPETGIEPIPEAWPAPVQRRKGRARAPPLNQAAAVPPGFMENETEQASKDEDPQWLQPPKGAGRRSRSTKRESLEPREGSENEVEGQKGRGKGRKGGRKGAHGDQGPVGGGKARQADAEAGPGASVRKVKLLDEAALQFREPAEATP